MGVGREAFEPELFTRSAYKVVNNPKSPFDSYGTTNDPARKATAMARAFAVKNFAILFTSSFLCGIAAEALSPRILAPKSPPASTSCLPNTFSAAISSPSKIQPVMRPAQRERE